MAPESITAQDPQHPIDKGPVVNGASAPVALFAGQNILVLPPLRFYQFVSLDHGNTSLLSIQATVKQIQLQKKRAECRFALKEVESHWSWYDRKIDFFPVGNGDMTLIELDSGRKVMIDLNMAADDPNDETPDVAAQLRERLERDSKERLYVDALLVSHPDKDHLRGW